ncbi:hypothetical protein [Desulfatitalea tepidiphila]|uniref:hypothetical protein n=1 Tax=Desulfatitalea tepidiphila TaxID=1185843 RepID=UPI0006B546DD|nr:hypothetical protein [Desulfatitalea tepidiphila]
MKCPGQDTQFWDAKSIFEAPCPQCGRPVEFFKDDTSRRCGHCGHRFVNPKMDFGCAAYCKFAEQCLGQLPPELVAQKEELFKDRVAIAVKRHLKTDFKRIGRAARRSRHAEQICREEQANPAAVLIAAYLWDIGAASPEAGAEGGPAHALLADLKAPAPLIEKVMGILGDPSSASGDGHKDRLVAGDAAAIVNLEDALKQDPALSDGMAEQIERQLKTDTGRAYARKMLLGAE